MRLNQEQLADRIDEAASAVTIGGRYMHYKQQYYTVTGIALRETDNEPCVIYRAEYGNHISFIRPLDDWLATVERNGQIVPRFQKID